MKKLLILSFVLITLFGCSPKKFMKAIIPDHIDDFAKNYISLMLQGNIDTCYSLMPNEVSENEARKYFNECFNRVKNYQLDTFQMVGSRKTSLMGENGFTNYIIDYEYKFKEKYAYYQIVVQEKENNLLVYAFNDVVLDQSMEELNKFSFKDKSTVHYVFFGFGIFIPAFMILTLIFAIKTELKNKWLWIIGILIGFMSIRLNWSTGEVGAQLISFRLLGFGITKQGMLAPWILSISIPFVSLFFWVKRDAMRREEKERIRLEKIKQKYRDKKNTDAQ